MNTPKVSILVAVYNTESYLRKCLDSLLGQSYPNIEVLCVDDCSTDNSLAILQEYAAKDSRVKVGQNKVNSGQAVTRNHAFSFATGDFVTMVDSDDWLSADAIEKVMEVFTAYPDTDSVLFNLVNYDQTNNTYSDYELHTEQTVFTGEEAMRTSLNWDIHGLYVTRRNIQEKFPYDESTRVYADDNTTRIHYLHSRNVRMCSGTYFYRHHSQSVTKKASVHLFDAILSDINLKDTLTENGVSAETLNAFERMRWHTMISFYKMYFDKKREFTTAEQNQVVANFRKAYNSLNFDKFPMTDKLKTLYLPFISFGMFRMWVPTYSYIRSHTPKIFLKKYLKL